MAHQPHYPPRAKYRTRRSGDDVDPADDMSATGLDRPRIDVDEMIREQEEAAAAETRLPRLPTWALVVGGVLLALTGAALGYWLNAG